jgi:hypothetical protein
VAPGADLRGRLMVSAIRMAGASASGAIGSRWAVRRVTLLAVAVRRERVQRWQFGLLMAIGAHGRSRDAVRSVGAMAVLAPSPDRGVKVGRLLRVASGACRCCRDAFAAMRLVATDALLVANRRRGKLLGVARAAGRGLGRLVRRWPVTRLAVMMTAILGGVRRFACMAIAAELATSDRWEAVRLVATRARGARGMDPVIACRNLRVA